MCNLSNSLKSVLNFSLDTAAGSYHGNLVHNDMHRTVLEEGYEIFFKRNLKCSLKNRNISLKAHCVA